MTDHDVILSRFIFLEISAVVLKKHEIKQAESTTPVIDQSKIFSERKAI